jgi:aspartokinase
VKETGGVLTADPRLVPRAERIPVASHRFLSELASAGARVIHQPAAAWAEREALRLRFTALGEAEWSTDVTSTADVSSLWAITLRAGRSHFVAPLRRTGGSDPQGRPQRSLWDAGLTADAEAVRGSDGWRLDLLAEAADLDDCLHALGAFLGAGERPEIVRSGLSTITIVTGARTPPRLFESAVQHVVAENAARLLRVATHPHRTVLLIEDEHGLDLLRLIHDRIVDGVSAHLGAA